MAATIEEVRRRKRDAMRRARSDPERRERMNAARRGKYLVQQREYRKKLREQGDFFKWRARLASNRWTTKVSAAELRALWDDQGGVCALTGRSLDRSAHLDHIVPLCRGGTHDLANLRWLAPEVNRAKNRLTDDEFVALCVNVAEWIGRRL